MTEHFHTLDCVGTNCKPAPAAEPEPLTLPPTISDDRLGDILADIFGPLPKVDDAGWGKLADGFRFLLFGDGYVITRLSAEPVPLRECVLTVGHQGLHRDVAGNEWSWFETTGHQSPAAEPVPLTLMEVHRKFGGLLTDGEPVPLTLDALTVDRLARAIQHVETPVGAIYPPIQPFIERAEAYLAALARPEPSAQEGT